MSITFICKWDYHWVMSNFFVSADILILHWALPKPAIALDINQVYSKPSSVRGPTNTLSFASMGSLELNNEIMHRRSRSTSPWQTSSMWSSKWLMLAEFGLQWIANFWNNRLVLGDVFRCCSCRQKSSRSCELYPLFGYRLEQPWDCRHRALHAAIGTGTCWLTGDGVGGADHGLFSLDRQLNKETSD